MKEFYIESEKRSVIAGSFTEFNQPWVGLKKGDSIEVVFTDPANGQNSIGRCEIQSIGETKIGLTVKPMGYTEVPPEMEIFLMGTPENYPVNS